MNRNHGPLSPASSASNDSYIPNYGNAPGPRQGGPGGGFMGAPSDIPYAGGPYGAARPMQTSPPSSNHPSSSTDASRPSGSSVGRPPSSSSSIGGRSMHPGANGHRDSTRSVFRPEHEDVLQKHYYSLQTYLAAYLRDEKGNMKPNRARDKLLRLSVTQFMELSTDVYDELIRREDDRTQRVPNVPRFLPPKQNFHPKRNQARQKLSTLPVERFRQLATDVFFELERRVPRFAASDIDRPMSGGRAPSRGGMRPPPGWRGPPGPRSRNPSEASLGRPLPKAFGGGTVVPNKSTMVEDDDDDIDDGSYSDMERDKETIRSQESEIEKLKEQAEEQTTLREDLEQKVQEAQILNDRMREELDMLKRNKLMDEQNLKDQHERELDNMRVSSGGSEEQQNKIQRLEEELAKQERLTIEVREESMANLQEMRELSRQNDRAVEQEEKLAAQVVSLEKDVEDWRERYAKLKSQNKSLRASTLGLQVDNGLKDLVSNNGLVKDVDITRFQLAVDELLKTARQTNTEAMIESVKQVTLSVRSIADIGTDGYPTPSSSPHEGTASVAKLKARVTGTANSLITATKQHASASGLSPVALLDAAASNLTAAVVELIKAVGIRASHGDSAAEDSYFGDEYATSTQDEHDSKKANGGWFNWARGTSDDMEPHANGHHEDDYDPYD